MTKQNDGGPAYPCSVRRKEKYMDEGGYGHTRTVITQEGGLSVRTWLVGQIVAGILSNPSLSIHGVPRTAIKIADETIKELGL